MKLPPTINLKFGGGKGPSFVGSSLTPAHGRTLRWGPRAIAASVLLLSLYIHERGTNALARIQEQTLTPLNSIILIGERHWAIRLANTGKSCVGYVRTVLAHPETPRISFDGSIYTLLAGVPRRVEINFRSQFDNDRKLTEVEADLAFNHTSLQVRTEKKTQRKLRADLTNGPDKYSFALELPDPIFLVQRGSEIFTLHFPPELEASLQMQTTSKVSIDRLIGISLNEIETGEVDVCKEELRQVEDHPEVLAGMIDLAKYGQFLRSATTGALPFLSRGMTVN